MAEERGVSVKGAAEYVADVYAEAEKLVEKLPDLVAEFGESAFKQLLAAAVTDRNPRAITATAGLLAGTMKGEEIRGVLAGINTRGGIEIKGVKREDLGMQMSPEMAVLMLVAQSLGVPHAALQVEAGVGETPALPEGEKLPRDADVYNQERLAALKAAYGDRGTVEDWLDDHKENLSGTSMVRRRDLGQLIRSKSADAAESAVCNLEVEWKRSLGVFKVGRKVKLGGSTVPMVVYEMDEARDFLDFVAEKNPNKLLLPLGAPKRDMEVPDL